MAAGVLVVTGGPAVAAEIPSNPCVAPLPTTKPVLTDVRLSARKLDVRRRAKTLVVTLRAHDTVPLSRLDVSVRGSRATAVRIGGTPTNGTWRATFPIRRFISSGTYQISMISLADQMGGWSLYRPSESGWGAWPSRVTVRSNPDRERPTVSGFSVSTRSVDTRTGSKAITVRVTARDNLSGVRSVRVAAIGTRKAIEAFLVRSATRADVWRARVVVPTWAGTGSWRFAVWVTDRRHHDRYLTAKGLAVRGWQSRLAVTSRTDATPPTLTALSFSETSVDARAGAVRVGFTFRATDAGSGLGDRIRLQFYPFESNSLRGVITSVTGPATDRTYHGYVLVNRCGTPLITWSVMVMLEDAGGNDRVLGSAALAASGFPGELQVRQVDNWAPTVWTPWTLTAGASLTLTFSEPVLFAAPMVDTLRVLTGSTPVPGSWECRNGSDVVVVCDADGAGVLAARFTPTTPFTTGSSIEVRPITTPPARTGIWDLDGVPLDDFRLSMSVV